MNPLVPPQQAPQPTGPVGPPPSPEQLAQAHDHLGIVTKTIMGLIAKPHGQLTKKDVIKGAADMIAQGAFSEAEGRQQLIAEMSKLPDDEGDLRQFLGQHLMDFAGMQQAIKAHMGGMNGDG